MSMNNENLLNVVKDKVTNDPDLVHEDTNALDQNSASITAEKERLLLSKNKNGKRGTIGTPDKSPSDQSGAVKKWFSIVREYSRDEITSRTPKVFIGNIKEKLSFLKTNGMKVAELVASKVSKEYARAVVYSKTVDNLSKLVRPSPKSSSSDQVSNLNILDEDMYTSLENDHQAKVNKLIKFIFRFI